VELRSSFLGRTTLKKSYHCLLGSLFRSSYSIDQSVSDLEVVLKTLGYHQHRIHLLGHSYGGNLAYEYAKKRPEMVQSLLLSNTSTSMKAAGDAYDRLAARHPNSNDHYYFWKNYVCSVDSPALDDAMQHVGSVWAGMDVVLDYVASPPPPPPPSSSSSGIIIRSGDSTPFFPRSVLVISCAKDFVGFESSQGWANVFLAGSGVDVEYQRLENCAHYPHLEDGTCFGRLLDDFMSKHDTV
jgi:pimeloyl-ACP methyl ester carboxylesterase